MSMCDNKYKEFCQLMKDVAKLKLNRILRTGSSAEVEGNDASVSEFCNEDSVDEDVMQYKRTRYVFSIMDSIPDNYEGEICRYVTEGVHPGYARLMKSDCGELTRADMPHEDVENSTIHGPAVVVQQRQHYMQKYKLSSEQAEYYRIKLDRVVAIHSPYWPREAVEWITRHRPHGSPSRHVIKRVVAHGCDFVCVSHKGNINHKIFKLEPNKCNEWRFSFSMVELILIQNWTRQQRALYRAVRVLHKIIQDLLESLYQVRNPTSESPLCTYYYKTLMLWAVETKPQNFWDSSRLLGSVLELLFDMIRHLKDKRLLNYFIPSNNLMDHLELVDLSDGINALFELCEHVDLVYKVLDFCVDEELYFSSSEWFVTLPPLYADSLTVMSRLTRFSGDNYENLFNEIGDEPDVESMVNTLMSTYELITDTVAPTNIPLHLQTGEYCYFNKMFRDRSTEYNRNNNDSNKSISNSTQLLRVNHEFGGVLSNFYQQIITPRYTDWLEYCRSVLADRSITSSSSCRDECTGKYLVYGRTRDALSDILQPLSLYLLEHENIREGSRGSGLDSLSITSFLASRVSTHFRDIPHYYTFWPGVSSTVPISWFIAKAYTANHYYTLLSDYETTLKICDEIINAYNASERNKIFAEYCFPVVLSTRWIDIYDRELKKQLGISTFCRFVTHGSNNQAVHLPLCPIKFALYLKLRCIIDTERYWSESIATEFNIHLDVCQDFDYFLYGTAALSGALNYYVKAAVLKFSSEVLF